MPLTFLWDIMLEVDKGLYAHGSLHSIEIKNAEPKGSVAIGMFILSSFPQVLNCVIYTLRSYLLKPCLLKSYKIK